MPIFRRTSVHVLGFCWSGTLVSALILWVLVHPGRVTAQQVETDTPTPWVVTATFTPENVLAAATRAAAQTEQAQTTGTATDTPETMVLATNTPTPMVVTNTPTPANSATATQQMLIATAMAFTTGTPDPNLAIVTATPTFAVTVISPTPEPPDVFAAATHSIELTEEAARVGTPTPLPRHIQIATRTPTPRVATATATAANAATALYHAAYATVEAFTTGTPNFVTPTPTLSPTPSLTPIIVTPTPRAETVFEAATRKADAVAQATRGETPTELPDTVVVATVTSTPRVVTTTPTPANAASATAQALHATAVAYTTGEVNVVTATPTRTPNSRQATRTAEAADPDETAVELPTGTPTPTATPTPTTLLTPLPTLTPTLTATAPVTVATILTVTPAVMGARVPSVSNFMACGCPCAGYNNQRFFPERTRRIYWLYEYENFPTGARYTHTWRRDGEILLQRKYVWYGPERGVVEFLLNDPHGLHPGTWEISIEVDNVTLMREVVQVESEQIAWNSKRRVNDDCE